MTQAFNARPPTVTLVRLDTGEQLEAQFMPEKLSESLEVEYSRQKVLGLSHQVKQYSNTGDYKIDVTLTFITNHLGANGQEILDNARKFLHSVCYPRKTTGTAINSAGAPRVLFVWPGLYELTCVVTSVKGNHERFNVSGMPSHSTFQLQLEEIRDVFISADDVRQQGTRRAAGSVGNKGGTLCRHKSGHATRFPRPTKMRPESCF